MNKFVFFIFVIFGFFGTNIYTCTGFVVNSENRVLIGNNEDYFTAYNDTVVKILPATQTKYGCLLVGFNQQNFAMGGMNEKGLFCDWFSVPENGWKERPEKENLPGGFKPEYILQYCSSIDEAISYLYKYNLNIFVNNRVLIADKFGNGVVVEWGGEDLALIWMEQNYIVSTNFLLNHPERGGHPCIRYNTAVDMLKKETPSLDLCRRILDNVHVVFDSYQTKYSNVYELQKGEIYLYNNHNFDEYIKMNLFEELNKGEKTYQLPEYFSKIKLLRPIQDEILDPKNVKFSCNGDELSKYMLVYSKNKNFDDSISLKLDRTPMIVLNKSLGFFYFGTLIFFGSVSNRKKTIVLLIFIFAVISISSCNIGDKNSQVDLDFEFSKIVSNLEPNTTYYWKIVATKSEDIKSHSIIRSFKTR